VSLAEHHGLSDGYWPAPIVVAAAVAARTRQAEIHLRALLLPLYDPVRLAENLAVLDAEQGPDRGTVQRRVPA
jgi:alkanesulfonate monooxygenase SsuD/methylene tetrahydromethanopterin reductase-like flavin-dependent oxidoreductase (luciferase family)